MRVVAVEQYPERARIGSRLRGARLAKHMTIKQVADACGLTEGFISRLERDLTSPSVATLINLCNALNIDAGALLSRTDAAHVKLENAPKLSSATEGSLEKLLTPRQESRVQAIHAIIEPGAKGNSQDYTVNSNVHFVHVLDGELTMEIQDQQWVLAKGDSLTFDGKESHHWTASPKDGATVLWFLTPATGE
ncbi:helix-turn-helix domain-containing protein [Ruicaihuangia caeni]|uniref:XRE family transcriptional regulator n=1 Tax=Ruicaihuangia caeni TaxID=3042517 RepID=A0AAW6TB47_9MICO|nr:XRE family transcriptional regulator [Klugiella sp. YN-L-19]MDI2098312.1 XRE family transcriptional regulator [Klugiella sp. YN-L-19]